MQRRNSLITWLTFNIEKRRNHEFRTLERQPLSPAERARAVRIVEEHGRCAQDTFKVWPDKSLFFSPSGDAFLAYRVAGSFAVALGDPVGPADRIEETIFAFAEWCEDNDWGVAFYQVLPDFLPVYERLGFQKLKVGHDAIVDLGSFSLEGQSMKRLRRRINQLERAGIQFVTYPPPIPASIIHQLNDVSDEWLRIPGRRERGFSLGQFDLQYLQSSVVFAVVDENQRILAFVNSIPDRRAGETTADLMRRRAEAPNGVMDFLLSKVFLDRRNAGYKRFNLGMAPMDGFQEHEAASREEKAIHYFFQHLNFIFSYAGLRHFKAKFATIWEPRCLIFRGTFDLARSALALGRLQEKD